MWPARFLAAPICVSFLICRPAGATSLVTGNGFGFAVVSPATATVSRLYAHPYSFARPEPGKPLSEGVPTANFIERLGWSTPQDHDISTDYDEDSNVIRARGSAGELFFFMPFGLRRSALVIDSEPAAGSAGEWKVKWSRPVRMRRRERVAGQEVELLKFDGIQESLLLIPLEPKRTGMARRYLAGSRGWVLISLASGDDIGQAVRQFDRWRAGLGARALVKREIAQLDRWRVRPPAGLSGKKLHLWRQSEVMLRMAQSREPDRPGRYGDGLIVASLPKGLWVMPWVRDMAWSTMALTRMGHREEARAALLAYFNARPTGKMRAQTGGADYQISVVRYFGNGAEEPFFTMEGGTNIEFDNWGEVLWALGLYVRQYHDRALLATPTHRGRLYESARDYVVKPLLENLEPYGGGLIVKADTSIWEEREKDRKHFAFSTAAAIVGLREFAQLARDEGDESTRATVLEDVALLRRGFKAAFIRGGSLHGTLEKGVKNDIDGALMTIIDMGVVTDPAVVRNTVARMELLKVASGGYRRVRSTYTDPRIFEYWYERQEFVFVDFSLAEAYRLLGREDEAEAILDRIVSKAADDHDIIPEMYVAVPCRLFPGEIGAPTGARPMVGYGAGEYILDILSRERHLAHASTRAIAAHGPAVAVTITTDDRTRRLQPVAGVFFRRMRPGPRTVFIDDRATYQTVQGFGAAWTDSTGYLLHEVASPKARERAMRALFTREDGGIGLSFMRIPMGASDFARSRYSYDDQPAGRSDPTLADFSIAHDRKDLIPLIRESLALNPHMTLMATPWSPPGWMKSTGSLIGGTLLPRADDAFAQYFVKFLRAYRRAGIRIHYITLQNEPLYQPSDYPGMGMSAAAQLALLRDHVLPALRAAGLPTQVLIYDHSWDRPDYPDTILSDPAVRASGQVAGIAWHGYAGVPGVQTLLHDKYPRFGQFETEHSGGTWVRDQVRSDFEEIIQVLRDHGRAYVKWNLALDQSLGPDDAGRSTCTPIVTVNTATHAVREDIEFATLGQFSRFILPGARRVYSSDTRGIESVALINPDGGHVLVAFNDTDGPDTFQVQWGIQGWRYTLPAYSGATFTWRGKAVGAEVPGADDYHAAASYASTGGRDTASSLSTWGVRDEQSSSPQGGYDLGYAADGDWAEYPGIDFRTAVASVTARVACGSGDCGTLEFHLGSPTGRLIARLPVRGTGGWQSWREVSGDAEAVTGRHEIYILWRAGRAGAGRLASLLSFQFH